MRREKRRLNNDNEKIKRVLYITGGILSLSVIAFIAIFILYGAGTNSNTNLAKFNSSVVDDYNLNTVEEASSKIGKTVNEMENEISNNTIDGNSVSNEISNKTISNSKEEDKKYAVNTSKTEEKNVEQVKEEQSKKDKEETNKEEINPKFKMPVEGEIFRKYAKENLVYSTTLDEWITHNGIDIKAPKTTVVKASAEGKIKSIKNDPRYGLTIVIEHQNGFSSVYSNLLTAEFVEEGEEVTQGQTIGTVGNTATFEIADETHLHFEILKNSSNVDPELYLEK